MFSYSVNVRRILFLTAILVFIWGCKTSSFNKPDLVIIYSNDILGELENCGCDDRQLGSLSRKAGLIKITQKKAAGFLSLDAGNLFYRKPPLNEIEKNAFFLKAEHILKAYNKMGCDALNIGEADFILGLNNLIALKEMASFPFISSNILDKTTGKPIFKPFVLREIAGLKVGIFGLCPETVKLDTSVFVSNPAATAKKVLKEIRGQCDFVVLLSSLGIEHDKELAKQVQGINIIISANAEKFISEPQFSEDTVVVQAYRRGQYLGKLDVEFAKPGRFEIDSEVIPLRKDIGDDMAVVDIVKQYRTKLTAMNKQEFFRKKIMSQSDNISGSLVYKGAGNCIDCHVVQYENWQKTFHASAYSSLLNERDSQYDIDCLPCHTTGYCEPGGYSVAHGDNSSFLNVQCEACHGPASNHMGKSGILRDAGVQICMGCHNEKQSPGFDYELYLPMVKCPPN